MTSLASQSDAVEPLLSAARVAEIIGFSPATVVDWSERGDLPAFKIGGRLRFRQSEVMAWIESQRKAAAA